MKTKIFYFCYDHQIPTGGQKHTYRHVDILNQNGFNAFVLHTKPHFRLAWFENHTRVLSMNRFTKIFNPESDYLVFPEDIGKRSLAFQGKKIYFDKNFFYNRFSIEQNGIDDQTDNGNIAAQKEAAEDLYLDKDVQAVFCVSKHNADFLHFTFPHTAIVNVGSSIDCSVFPFMPLTSREPLIVFPAKAGVLLNSLQRILIARARQGLNSIAQFKWIRIENMSEKEVSSLLQKSLLLLFLSYEEGLPRLPLEAIACGSLPLSFGPGTPQSEYLPPELLFTPGDLLGMARQVEIFTESFLKSHGRDPLLNGLCKKNLMVLKEHYSPEKQEERLLSAWCMILGKISI